MAEQGRMGRMKYTHGGVVFIYDPKKKREITCFKSEDASKTSGTCTTEPIMLSKMNGKKMSSKCLQMRREFQSTLMDCKDKWTSHSVLIVDMSGSMRRDDVNGARCRSDGVWMALARDYIRGPLHAGNRSATDLVSVVVMRETPEVVFTCEPIDWFLYNKFLEMREWQTIRPFGPGNYMPAIDTAESLLNLNTIGTCALSLLFFSDGKPSDVHLDHRRRFGELASKFGRRLSIKCIGMAETNEDFSALENMTEEAESFGAAASFENPSLCAESLGSVISSLATSLTSTMTEMTKDGRPRAVRMDVSREKRGISDDLHLTEAWSTFHGRSVGKFLCWSLDENNFIELFDYRCNHCGQDTRMGSGTEMKESACICTHCLGTSFCNQECFNAGCGSHNEGGRSRTCNDTKKLVTDGKIRRMPLPSYSVAVKNEIYGEGAELMVRKFRFINKNDCFTGIKYVAKESRFVEDTNEVSGVFFHQIGLRQVPISNLRSNIRHKNYMTKIIVRFASISHIGKWKYDEFHRDFLRTQAMASDMAKSFNRVINDLLHISPSNGKWRSKVKKLPRINFLEPIIVEIYTGDKIPARLMIEPFLGGKYDKFNNNMGYVKGPPNQLLSVIAEEEEEDCSVDSDTFSDSNLPSSSNSQLTCKDLDDKYFPQAFSHFSYEKSNRKFMVVDLQGVFTLNSDGTKSYDLTDPVIHTHRQQNEEKNPVWKFGRTDRGTKGINAFFESHVCTDVCRLLGLQKH